MCRKAPDRESVPALLGLSLLPGTRSQEEGPTHSRGSGFRGDVTRPLQDSTLIVSLALLGSQVRRRQIFFQDIHAYQG
eukprot:4320765-Alexandrium_andersonii.AAC.1